MTEKLYLMEMRKPDELLYIGLLSNCILDNIGPLERRRSDVIYVVEILRSEVELLAVRSPS